MTDPNLFWTVFAAVLGANLLSIAFVWSMLGYSRHEKNGTAGNTASNGYLAGALLVFGFMGLSFYIAMGG